MSKSRRRRQHPAQGNRSRTSQDEKEAFKTMREVSQLHMELLWESYQNGLPLDDEEARTAQIMAEHPEYHDLWDHLSTVSEEALTKDGTNPVLHVTVHTTVENQLAANDPPEVREALERLLKQGIPRHEAIHNIAYVLSEEIFHVLHDNEPYNNKRYTRGLKKLGR